MCSICGIASFDGLNGLDRMRVARMNNAMLHRGPDCAGDYERGSVIMAMRRLSIIDLQGGSQPLFNEDRSIAVIANGEIYNYVELRKELETRGHRFATGSDCETIAHLYEEYADNCVEKLRGMFAFALYDTNTQRLLLARDRMGEKPLYLSEHSGRITFASELKALLQSGSVYPTLNAQAVDLYFHYGFVPEPWTIIEGVRKLEAGCTMVVDMRTRQTQQRRYWDMTHAPEIDGNPVESIREKLHDIGRIVIRADVPVGVALSGGLDSALVAALAAQYAGKTVHAFTVGYEGCPASDERKEAAAIAKALGIEHHTIELTESHIVDHFQQLHHWIDDPVADIANAGYYAVMAAARQSGVPVMLQGQGADELFWGYWWARDAAKLTQRKMRTTQHALANAMNYLALQGVKSLSFQQMKTWASNWGGLRAGIKDYRRDLHSPANRMRFYDLTPTFASAAARKHAYYTDAFASQLNESAAWDVYNIDDSAADVDAIITRAVCASFLRCNGIVQGDRLSMANSVEARLPLLDHEFVETVIGLRRRQSDRNLQPKAWLKEAARGLVPQDVIDRSKRGFTPPVRRWSMKIFERHGGCLRDGYLVEQGILNAPGAERLGTWPIIGVHDLTFAYKALVLENWCRAMLDQQSLTKAA